VQPSGTVREAQGGADFRVITIMGAVSQWEREAALAEVQNLRRQGHTLRGIAATLNNRGHCTRRGTEWRLESVARVVKQNARPPHAKTA
jgi:hypothetical protein